MKHRFPDATADGVVREIRDGAVRATISYGADERMLCDLPRAFWSAGQDPEPDQRFRLRFYADLEQPTIQVLPPLPTAAEPESAALTSARNLLGLYAGDRVTIVVGPNPMPEGLPRPPRYSFINAGWGEFLGMERFMRLLWALGVAPKAVQRVLCQTGTEGFDPEDANGHIIFLGSTVSNDILRQYYWPRWSELQQYRFVERRQEIALIKVDGRDDPFAPTDNLHEPSGRDFDAAMAHVHDYFLLARMPNPYARDERSKCVLCCGAGTIGTGYGAVAATAAPSVLRILKRTGGDDFHLIGDVDMDGLFNPRRDPVRLRWYGNQQRDEMLLAGALASPAVWDEEADYIDELSEAYYQMIRRLAGEHRT